MLDTLMSILTVLNLSTFTDYQVTDGQNVTLTVQLGTSGDVIEFVAYKAFNLNLSSQRQLI